MRSSHAAVSVFMILLISAAQGIHMEGKKNCTSPSKRLFHQNEDVKVSAMKKGSGAALVLCREDRQYCSKNSSPSKNVGVDQKIPRIHEDYYGPGDHKSKHH